MSNNRWHRGGETARIEQVRSDFVAWNESRCQLAVCPRVEREGLAPWPESAGYPTREECEAALRAEGWELVE
jgi:hypothetical protein